MSYGRRLALATLAALIALTLPADAQSVISTHSGVIYFFEGTVYLGDQPLVAHLGKFPSVPQGAELRTEEGRAEVLLTPGVFLRIGQRSAIRMVANHLADTQVELESGSALVDAGDPNSGTSVTLTYKNWRVHFLQKGIYRIDTDPPRLLVRQGEAEVFTGIGGTPVAVEHGMNLPFAGVLVPERANEPTRDALSDWAAGRTDSIFADSTITSQIDQDPAAQTAGLDNFTYFPALGLPSYALGLGTPYSSFSNIQPGFYSLYLPGYTYRPLLFGLIGRGYSPYLPSSSPLRIGTSRFGTSGIPIVPLPRPTVIGRPTPGIGRPGTAPVHVAPHVAAPHVGAHR